MCDHLVDGADLRARAHVLAEEIAASGPLATRSIKQTMRGPLLDQLRDAMAHERAEQDRLQRTDDFREGVAAVRDRRIAKFTGR